VTKNDPVRGRHFHFDAFESGCGSYLSLDMDPDPINAVPDPLPKMMRIHTDPDAD